MYWDILLGLFNKGPLALSGTRRARFELLKDDFLSVADDEIQAALLAGIAWTESDFVPTARNKVSNAAGLMQIMPFHFPRFGWTGGEWADPVKNIRAGKVILVNDKKLGKVPISETLAGYGGFVTKDPNAYIEKVLTRSTALLPEFILS